jgi:hypothetical protein
MLWKEVPGFPDYEVSEHGDVRKGLKYFKPERVQGSGRKRFTLTKDRRRYVFHAAHLVAMAFIGPKPFRRAEVCHNDGFEHNNHYSNLRWDSRLGNVADAVLHRFKCIAKGRATISGSLGMTAQIFQIRDYQSNSTRMRLLGNEIEDALADLASIGLGFCGQITPYDEITLCRGLVIDTDACEMNPDDCA